METIFKVGDRVFDIHFGWGTVIEVNRPIERASLLVRFDGMDEDDCLGFYKNGYYGSFDIHPRLSFTEYTFSGFSQERPKKEPEIGSLCLFSDDEDRLYENTGITGILTSISEKQHRYSTKDRGSYKFCKQIKIEEL
jgi:hypothetical protein